MKISKSWMLFVKKKNVKKAPRRDWTVDLSICNRMLYHWAIGACTSLSWLGYIIEEDLLFSNAKMSSSREELYDNLARKIAVLNEELVRFTRQAEATQSLVVKASSVTTMYSKMYVV